MPPPAKGNLLSSSQLAMYFNSINLTRIRFRRSSCLFLLVFLLGFSHSFSIDRQEKIVDRIAAVVNESVITLSDVRIAASFDLFADEFASEERDPLRILDGLINQKLVIGLTQNSLPVTPESIEVEYKILLDRLGKDVLQSKLDSFSLQKEDLQVYLSEKILYQKIIENRFGLAVRVSLREIEEYYEKKFSVMQRAKNIEPPPMMDVLEDIESAIKRDKIKILVEDWLKNLRREADIQILLKEEERS